MKKKKNDNPWCITIVLRFQESTSKATVEEIEEGIKRAIHNYIRFRGQFSTTRSAPINGDHELY